MWCARPTVSTIDYLNGGREGGVTLHIHLFLKMATLFIVSKILIEQIDGIKKR